MTLPDGRHVALAVFTKQSRRAQAEREKTIARIARAVYDHWAASAGKSWPPVTPG